MKKHFKTKKIWAPKGLTILGILLLLGGVSLQGQTTKLKLTFNDGRVERLSVTNFNSSSLLEDGFYRTYNLDREQLKMIGTDNQRFVFDREEEDLQIQEVLIQGSMSLWRSLRTRDYQVVADEAYQDDLGWESLSKPLDASTYRRIARQFKMLCASTNDADSDWEWTDSEPFWMGWVKKFNRRCGDLEFEKRRPVSFGINVGLNTYLGQLQTRYLPCSPRGGLMADAWSQWGIFGAVEVGRRWTSFDLGLSVSYRQHGFDDYEARDIPNSLFSTEQEVEFDVSYLTTTFQLRYNPFRSRWNLQPVLGVEVGVDWTLRNDHRCLRRGYSRVDPFEFDETLITERDDLGRSDIVNYTLTAGLRYKIIEAGFFRSWLPQGIFEAELWDLDNIVGSGVYVKIFYNFQIGD